MGFKSSSGYFIAHQSVRKIIERSQP